MGTPLTDWGYCSRKAVRSETSTSSGTSYGSWSYTYIERVVQPSSVKIGTHSQAYASDGGGSTWTRKKHSKYDDYPYIIFSLPTSTADKTLSFTLDGSSRSTTIYIRRITSEISGNGIPSNTTTHQITLSNITTGDYEVNVSTLLDDLEENGNYGLLFYGEPSDNLVTYKSFTVSNLEFNWEDNAATTPTFDDTSYDIGTQVSITLANEQAGAVNTLTYEFGTESGTIASLVGNGTYTWTPPLTLCEELPTTTAGTCYIYCSTALAGQDLGTTVSTISLTVPSSVKCTVSSVSLEEYNTEIEEEFNAYVQGKSQLTVTATTSDAGAYGSEVVSYSIGINGGTLTENGATTNPLRISGTNTYTVSVTDSRGRVDTYTGTFSVLAYAAPTSLISSAVRDSNTPSTILVSYSWSISPLNNINEKSIEIYADEVLVEAITPAAYTGTATYSITGTTTTDSVTIVAEVADFFTEASYSFVVPFEGSIDIDVGPDGSIGLGMEAQENHELDVGLKANLNSGLSVTGNASMSGDVSLTSSSLQAGGFLSLDANKKIVTTSAPSAGMVLLWTNPNPTSSMATNTTVPLDLSGYTAVAIHAVYNSSSATLLYGDMSIIPVGGSGRLSVIAYTEVSGSNRLAFAVRPVTVSVSGVLFRDAARWTYNSATSGTAFAVPEYIYGIL